ncbi:MAG: MalY/PatB family protein [Tissierella sp.]|uniref:MalY/PatB family protein n=1 Tax=Tissierella sp. TaxID=41274 RepID=UPI003F980C50
MYKYDDNTIDRSNTASVKYEEMDMKFGRDDLTPLWVADMDIKAPDFIIDAIKKRAEHGIFGYSKRMPEFYDSIVNWLDTRHDLKVTSEDIEYAPGVVFLLNMMIRKFTEKGDKIIIQPPVYYPFKSVIEGNDRVVMESELVLKGDKYEMDFEDLKKKASHPDCKMMLLCSPHNPTGRVWKKEELEKLGRICIDNDVLVVSDEIHYDLVYKPNKHIPFASISDEFKKNSITCTAPSKTFNIAGLHSAFCIINDKERMDIYRSELGLLDLNRSNVFSQTVTQTVYENGHEWVDGVNEFLKGNMEYCVDYINKNIDGIHALELEGTYLLWMDCRGLHLSLEKLDDLFINKAGLALDSGHWFGKPGEGFMRLNLACPREVLKDSLEKLEAAVKSL